MNREEIDYWLKSFSNNNQSFMSKDGKIITLFKVFQELKELQCLLKTQNDYINELDQKNQELKEVIEKAIKYLDDWLFNVGGMGACMEYEDIIELLDILKEVNR